MSTSYYLIDKASLERKKQHYKQVEEVIQVTKQLCVDKLTVADTEEYMDDVLSIVRRFDNELSWLIEAHEQEICNTGYKRCTWHMNKEELQEQYNTGYYAIQDEYRQEYTLEEFMRKVEG